MTSDQRDFVLKRVHERGIALVAVPDQATAETWTRDLPPHVTVQVHSDARVDGEECCLLEFTQRDG
jgi:ribosomal protein S10